MPLSYDSLRFRLGPEDCLGLFVFRIRPTNGKFGSFWVGEHPDRTNPPLCPGFLLHRKGRLKRLNPQRRTRFCQRVSSHRLIYSFQVRAARQALPRVSAAEHQQTDAELSLRLYLSPASQQPRATPDHRPVPPPIGLPRTRPARSFLLIGVAASAHPASTHPMSPAHPAATGRAAAGRAAAGRGAVG